MSKVQVKSDKEMSVELIPIEQIFADDEFNCRGTFSASECIELAKDIQTKGLQQPIIVRPLRTEVVEGMASEKDIIEKGYKYKLLAGYRRLKSYVINSSKEIPAIVRKETMDEFVERDINAIENLQRKELNLEQECRAIRHYWQAGWDRYQVAARIGKSPGWVQLRFMLLEMPPEVMTLAGQGYIKQDDLRELNKHKKPEDQLRLAALLRDKRIRGEKNITQHIRKKDKPTTKKIRKRDELLKLNHLLQNHFAQIDRDDRVKVGELFSVQGNSLTTRVLGWAAGEVTTYDLHVAIRDTLAILGYEYPMPDFEGEIAQETV